MKALIVENAYIKNPSQLHQAQRIGEELEALGVKVDIKKNFNLAKISSGPIVADKYDFCVFLDKDKVAARLLEGVGLRLFNRARAIEDCDDKMLTNIALSADGLNVPDCVYAPLCYTEKSVPNVKFLATVAENLGFPLVAKTNYGSLGAGVTLIKTAAELEVFEAKNIFQPHFYQRFIDCGRGEDTRVIVIGGRAVCAMQRVNDNDFRSNIELGGRGERVAIDEELENICVKSASVLGLDYCGVDVLTDKQGRRYVCEVNSNAFFAAAEKVCKVNVAAEYARYMVSTIKNS